MNFPMNILDFLYYVKLHDMEFINYCEIIIDPKGMIHLARPSHTEKIIELRCIESGQTDQDIWHEIPVQCIAYECNIKTLEECCDSIDIEIPCEVTSDLQFGNDWKTL